MLSSIPANIKATGSLRVSNRSEHPVRVALLSKRQAEKSYGKPAHWDFAPGEGGGKGLMLSLPEGKLQVKQGDILVVFAQDGSRRYWGPSRCRGDSLARLEQHSQRMAINFAALNP